MLINSKIIEFYFKMKGLEIFSEIKFPKPKDKEIKAIKPNLDGSIKAFLTNKQNKDDKESNSLIQKISRPEDFNPQKWTIKLPKIIREYQEKKMLIKEKEKIFSILSKNKISIRKKKIDNNVGTKDKKAFEESNYFINNDKNFSHLLKREINNNSIKEKQTSSMPPIARLYNLDKREYMTIDSSSPFRAT